MGDRPVGCRTSARCAVRGTPFRADGGARRFLFGDEERSGSGAVGAVRMTRTSHPGMASLEIDVLHRNQAMARHVHGGLRLFQDHVAEEGFRVPIFRPRKNRFVEEGA